MGVLDYSRGAATVPSRSRPGTADVARYASRPLLGYIYFKILKMIFQNDDIIEKSVHFFN
jgi:hypothetical protein